MGSRTNASGLHIKLPAAAAMVRLLGEPSRTPGIVRHMSTTDPDQAAANALLVSRMQAWAEFEDRYEPLDENVVAVVLPQLLELAEAFPAGPRTPLDR